MPLYFVTNYQLNPIATPIDPLRGVGINNDLSLYCDLAASAIAW